MRHEVTTRPVLYRIAGMDAVRSRAGQFPGADGEALPLRIYEPASPASDAIVAIVAGYPDPGFEARLGCPFMDMQWTIDIATLIAASGLRAVTHSNRDPEPDALALLRHLRSLATRIGIWSTSGHAPVALAAAAHATCVVVTNPMTKNYLPPVPTFIARSGRDETPGLNAALDALVAQAVRDNYPITLVNDPDAPHSPELFRDAPETKHVLRQGLDFLKAHLTVAGRQ